MTDSDLNSDLTGLFAATGVPAAFAARAAARLGAGAAARLRDDPWRLLRVPGVRPAQADHFARQVLGDAARPDDPRRGRALVEHLLTEAARQGHTATPAADVESELAKLRVPDPRKAIDDALDEAEVLSLTEEPEFDEAAFEDDEADLPEPEETLGLARWALPEEAAAEGFQRLNATASPLMDDAAVKEARAGLPEDRSLALTASLRRGVCVLRGTPDDLAETALLLARVATADGLRAAVVTATERAAAYLRSEARKIGPVVAGGSGGSSPQNETDLLGEGDVAVVGLHRLLEPVEDAPAAPGAVVFGRGEQRPFELDLVVLPDAAGMDVELVAVLVEACADGTHLVLGGEPGALPPSGPGQILGDLAASETVPVIDLEPAPAADPLGTLTAAVRAGELVPVEAPGKEVVIVPAAGAHEAVHRAVQLVTDSIPRALGIALDDVQVVAPAAGGEAGTTALNAALKARVNPGPGAYGGFDPGDRVVVVAPLPQAAAGETGTVTGAAGGALQIAFAGGTADVPAALTGRLRHGWAVTVAQGRGTRRPAVVAVMSDGAGLSRPLVATAFGLAWRHLSVVQAAGPALARAVRETEAPARRTRLARLLTQ